MIHEELFRVSIRHTYYPDCRSPDFAIVPGEATRALLRDHRAIARVGEDRVLVLEARSEEGVPLHPFPPDAAFRFHLFLREKDFPERTQLGSLAENASPVFVPQGDMGLLQPSQDSAEALPVGVFADVVIGVADLDDGSVDDHDPEDCPPGHWPPGRQPPGGRPPRGRPPGGWSSGGPRSGGPRSGGPRSGGSRSGGWHSGGPRSGGPRSGGPHPGGPHPDDGDPGGGDPDGDDTDGDDTGGAAASDFELHFDALSLPWRYYLRTDLSPDRQLEILDSAPDSDLSFAPTIVHESGSGIDPASETLPIPTEPDERLLCFVSDRAVPIRRFPLARLELHLDGERLTGPLPVPRAEDPAFLGFDDGEPFLFRTLRYRQPQFSTQESPR